MKDLDRSTWDKLEPLFEAALEMEPEARARFVDEVCAGDVELKRRLRALLEADAATGGILDESAGLLAAISAEQMQELSERGRDVFTGRLERAGAYRVVRLLGRGGMGAVYLAERDDGQYRQRVALKVLSSLAASDELRAQFLKERQIQAQLAHPNIARLLDGGVTDDGLPYLVMEFVEGRPITEHCRAKDAGLAERLDLFGKVCEAVSYANRNLIVHRDLKPGNILVTESGEVKLVDFGIAKLLAPEGEGASAAETTLHLFTPRYAAPEQLEGKPVTTATDVYSVGVVLYELLSGSLPIPEDTPPLERLKLILDTVPAPPSRAPGRVVEGTIDPDLDAICLKALRSEPGERYPSAEALRADLARYRAHRPVEALLGTTAYRLRKFARRNRLPVAAASVVLAALLLSALVSAFQARQAAWERDRAVKAEARTRAINDFLVYDMLKAATPEEARGDKVTVVEVLEAASRRIGRSFEDQPALEADVRLALGRSYLSLGEHAKAQEHVERAVALRAAALGEADPETLEARSELAEVHLAMGNYGSARALLEPTSTAQKALSGPEGLATLVTEGRLAQTLFQEGRYLAAEEEFEKVLRRLERSHPRAWREALLLRARLGRALNLQRKDSESEAFLRETLSLQRERLGPEHPDTLATMSLLVDSLRRLLRFEEAIPLAEEARGHHEKVYGRGHPRSLDALESLARVHWFEDRPRVEALLLDVLERSRESLGPEHDTTLGTLMNLAQNADMQKKHDVAEPRFREALALSRRLHGDEHPKTLRCLRFLATFLTRVGRGPEASRVFREIITISDRMAAKEDADATFLSDYAWLLMTYVPEDMRDAARALPLAERAVALTKRGQIEFLHSLARAYRQTGRLDEGIGILREIYRHPDSVHRYDVERDMVEYLEARGDAEGVETFLLENLARRKAAREPADPLIGQTLRLLGLHSLKHGRPEEAASRLRAAAAVFLERSPETHRTVAITQSELGEALVALGRYEEAEALLKKSVDNLHGENDVLPAARERLAKLYRAWGRTPR